MSPSEELHRELEQLQAHLPAWAARILREACQPEAIWRRLSLAFALVIAGIAGTFLPILANWMVPVGLALLAIDLPFLRPPLTRVLAFINRKVAPRLG
jgi:hypothetical protein